MSSTERREEEEEEIIDQFDRLPDALLHLIFNKLHDAQSLTRSAAACKRFASVIPEIDNVSIKIPRKIGLNPWKSCSDCSKGGSKSRLRNLIRKIVTRPIQFLLRIVALKSSSRSPSDDDTDCSYHSPNEILKNFKGIQSLRIELPSHGGEIGSDDGDSLLRWRAEFGSELESCVIFGAKSFHKSSENPTNGEEIKQQQQPDQEFLLNDEELKLRIVWTISCLIASSARHYLLQQVVSDHPTVRSAVVSDGNKQGKLCMSREQIEELRSKVKLDSSAAAESERTPVPALKMKLWYVPELAAAGWVMKGATLLVIKPVGGGKEEEERDGDLVGRVWDKDEEEEEEEEEKVYGEAVREMMKKKKSYTLEMNSF